MAENIALRILGALTAVACLQSAQRVDIRDGNVVLVEGEKPLKQLTSSKRDYAPALSPDGSVVVFCRKPLTLDSWNSSLWQVTTTGANEQVLSGGPILFKGLECSGCDKPDFSPDGARVFYLAQLSDTSGLLVAVDLRPIKVRPLSDAIDYKVVKRGKYAGHIVALKRKHTLVQTWNWYWLLDVSGGEIAAIGDDEALRRFEEMYEE